MEIMGWLKWICSAVVYAVTIAACILGFLACIVCLHALMLMVNLGM